MIGAILVALVAALTDARSERIPNWLTLPALVFGALWHPAHIAYALGAGLVAFALFVRGNVGGGDVKLIAALTVLWPLGSVCACALAWPIVRALRLRRLGPVLAANVLAVAGATCLAST